MNANRPDRRLTLALEAGRAGTFNWDVQQNQAVWSDELLALYGIAREQLKGTYEEWLESVIPEDRSAAAEAIRQSLQSGTFEADFRIRRREDGQIRWMQARGVVSLDAAGQPIGMLGINLDITDLKAAQEKSALMERRFQIMLGTGDVGVLFLDRTGRVIGANQPFLNMTGYSADEIRSHALTWQAMTPPDWVEKTEAEMQKLFATGSIGPYEKEIFLKNGVRRWMRFTGNDLGDGTIAEYCFDIQDQKEAETALRESEAKYRALFDSMDEGYVLTEVIFTSQNKPVDILYLEANAAAVRMTGVPLAGRRATELSPNFESHWFETFGRVAKSGKGERHEYSAGPLNAIYDIYIFPAADLGTNRVAAIYRDVTERNRNEEALRKSEERFRFIADRAQVGYWDWDIPSDTLEFSDLCKRMFGLPEDKPVTYQSFLLTLHPDDRERTDRIVKDCLHHADSSEYDNEYRAVWPDGSIHWLRSKGAAIFQDGRAMRMAGIVIDISEAKRVESKLELSMLRTRESESQFQMLAESVPQLVWTCNSEGKCDYLSSQWVAYTGIPAGQQLGYNWLERLHPEDRNDTMAHWRKSVESGDVFDVEYRILGGHGRYRWFKTRALAQRNEQGEIEKWFGTSTDIEDQKRVEEELRQANNDLQQFAYSASHDLKQPLRNIVIYGQLLQRTTSGQLNAEAQKLLDVIINNGQRMSRLLSDLLEYSSAGRVEPDDTLAAVSSESVLQNVIASLQSSISDSAARITHDPLPLVRVSEFHLQQLLQNLLANGLKYRKDHEAPRLHLSAQPAGFFWRFSVADNGIGIDRKHHSQVFGLFKRLHGKDGKYEGTGLGLAISQRIVERYGGRIWFDSEIDQGTVFHFTLPRAD